LPQGSVVISTSSASFVANGQVHELMAAPPLAAHGKASGQEEEEEEEKGALASSNEIAEIQAGIQRGVDPTTNFEAAAAGGEIGGAAGAADGSGNGGFINIDRTAAATLATAGFDTDYQAQPVISEAPPRTPTVNGQTPTDVAPAIPPSISVNAPDNTNDTTPTITGKTDAAPGSTVTIIVTDSAGNTQELVTTVKPDGSYSVDVEIPLAEGEYKAEASVTDPAGNTGNATDDGSVDITAPTITVDAPDNTNDTTPTITGQTDAAPGSTVTIVVTDSKGNEQTLTTTVKPDGSYSVDVETPLAEGEYKAEASVTDPAGNTATDDDLGSVDITAPIISVVAPDNTNDTTPTITGTTDAAPGSTVTIVVTDAKGKEQTLTTTVKPDGSYSVDVETPLAEGEYKAEASVTDPAGNTATDDDLGSVDITAPIITVVAPDNTNDTTPMITGQTDAAPGSTVTIIVTDSAGNKQELVTTVKPDGSYSVDVEIPLAEGDYKAEASVTDPAGNTATDDDLGSVDITAPIISVVAPDNTNDTTPTITGKTDAAPGSTVTIVVTDSAGNKQELVTTVKPDGSYSVDVETPLAEGEYKAEASVTDPAGNTATDDDLGSVDITAPTITVDAPDNTNDTTPTITGQTDAAPGSTVTIIVTDSAGNSQEL
ncbi:MAG: retention module-containing protein, partial [Aeromonas sp.]